MKSPTNYLRLFLVGTFLCVGSCSKDGGGPTDLEESWFEGHAVVLNSSDVGVPEPNLAALPGIIGNARIVALGEGNHGSSDFWSMRQKITEFLVEEMGFTAILMEAGFPNGFFVNDYVVNGAGSAAEAHEKLGVWRYEEMRTLIEWMSGYNVQNGGSGRTVQYFGFDCAFGSWDGAIELIGEFLEVADPGVVAEVSARLANYTVADAQWIEDYFVSNSEPLIQNGGEEAYKIALRIIENLEPSWVVRDNLVNGLPTYELRDSTSAGNVDWIIDELLDGGKVILWAANGHVGRTIYPDGDTEARMLGWWLKESHGSAYYNVASEFYGGQFMALGRCPGQTQGFVVHTAEVPLEDTYAHRFHMEGIPLFFLDLRSAELSLPEVAWIPGPLLLRRIGASYCPSYDREWYTRLVSLPEEYDGVLFFEQISPVTPVG
ncbi:MAG: erythromycin esterase family protein [Gemmatimonadota bacterium]|jgi:erythromycin esterase